MGSTTPSYPELAAAHTAALTEAVLTARGTRLRLAYADGFTCSLAAETLRLACRCAWCSRARLDQVFPESFPEISIRDIAAFGSYAFNLAFSDGHARGVFPFAYLRSLAASPTLEESKIP